MAFPIRVAFAAAVAALATAGHAAQVPALDVSGTCRPIGRDLGMQIDSDRCLKSEREARDQLARQWADFPPADRTLCTQTATMAGMASYVALLTCLEMKRDVAKLPPDRGLRTRPSNLPVK